MNRLVLATRNAHKIVEMTALLSPLGLPLLSLEDFPPFPEPAEDGATFEENALIKASATARTLGEWALADDSGLVIDALDGRPGIYSARYAPDNPGRIARVLSELEGVPSEKRTARFVCAMVLAAPDGRTWAETATCEGLIHTEPVGMQGFGYDPVFRIPEMDRTMAELAPEEKNLLSHRGRAAAKMRGIIQKVIDSGRL